MEFIALPPEVTSALMHSGPGAESLIEASGAWQLLGSSLEESASGYAAMVSALTETWQGPSSLAMVQAVEPYITWLRTTAQQSQQLSSSTQAAAAAFSSTLAAVVHPSVVSANRVRLAQLVATNRLGGNLAAIAATETQYQDMWANNSAAMYRYEATSAQTTALSQFTTPPSVTNPAGVVAQAKAVPAATAAATPAATAAAAANPINLGFTDPTTGYFGLFNQYINQFISSGFPINLLSYAAQNSSAQALQTVGGDVGQGLSEGMESIGGASRGLGSLGAAGLSAQPTAAIGVGVSVGKLTAPPAVVGLLPAQAPVQLASAVSPLPVGDSGFPMLPMMPPPISAGSGWRKRKQQKYEDISIGKELKGTVMPRPPSAG
jgi:PPE-repeat protein